MRNIKTKFAPALCLILISLSSCIREEIIPLSRNGQSKIVVIGFLTPAPQIDIYVGRSQPFGKLDYQPIDFTEPNAVVKISNEYGSVKVLNSNSSNPSIYSCSQTDFPIIAGKKYTITVTGDTGTINASTVVPPQVAYWKTAVLSGPQEDLYYTFSGSWEKIAEHNDVDYGVSIKTNGKALDLKTNEGINKVNNLYTVKRDVFLGNSQTIHVTLLTRDPVFSAFSRKTDLTVEVFENLKSSAFSDIISGFKGVIPDAGNISGGIGVFGSYLKDTKILNK